jgi:outer membrane protein assembly factor BamE (lipoprotein component of BamABCDE complex)
MKAVPALPLALARLVLACLALALGLAACATFDGRGLTPGVSNAADVESVMGAPAEKRQAGAETWYYYPRQPYGRMTFVARLGPDGRLIAIEQRLTDENVAKIVPNSTRAEQVRDLFGPPYTAQRYARLDRDIWSWHMRRYGDPGIPVSLNVQMSPDGVVREVYIIDESSRDPARFGGTGLGIGFGF